MRLKTQKREGIVAVIVAVSLVAILGVVAITVDGGMLLDDRQRVQVAADAAALAAACDLYSQMGAGGNGRDSSGTAAASARSTATANGFNNDGVTSTVTVNIPPTSGNFVGKAGYAEVLVQYNRKRGFSRIFATDDLPVQARAVARGIVKNDVGILLLDPNITVAAQICGIVNILGDGQIYCNSDSTVLNSEFKGYGTVGGVYLESTAKLTCSGINIVGYVSKEAGASITYNSGGGVKTGVGPWADPLASVPEPVVPTGTATNVNSTGNMTINPGLYGTINVKSGTLTMNPGVYYITGGLSVTGTLVGNGVMFYNTSGDKIDFQDAVSVTLTPPTSGPYKGISIFEPRAETKEVHIKASNTVTIAGTLYAQAGEFDLRPDFGSVMNCGSYICAQAEWCQGYKAGGSSAGTINIGSTVSFSSQRPMLVE